MTLQVARILAFVYFNSIYTC